MKKKFHEQKRFGYMVRWNPTRDEEERRPIARVDVNFFSDDKETKGKRYDTWRLKERWLRDGWCVE